jgi:hypothetical protein
MLRTLSRAFLPLSEKGTDLLLNDAITLLDESIELVEAEALR